MEYEKYKASRDLSWQILLDMEICRFPVKISDICRKLGVGIKIYQSQNHNDGFTTSVKGKTVIFVNGKCNIGRQRFTAAHELGHILNGHVGKYKLVNREPSKTDNPIEQEANVFASRLLAPACVLWGCNVQSAEDIMRLCDISHQAAEYRMERMRLLYERGKFLTSSLEREVYKQFSDYIKANKL